jgi:hypothetical protein
MWTLSQPHTYRDGPDQALMLFCTGLLKLKIEGMTKPLAVGRSLYRKAKTIIYRDR